MKNAHNPRFVPHRRIATLVVLACAAAVLAQRAETQVSLATVVDLAQRNSTAVRAAQADVDKAKAALDQVHDAYIPNFTVGTNAGYSHGYPAGQPSVGNATMQSLVFSFPQRQYLKAARAGIDAAHLSFKDACEQTALDTSSAYIELDAVNRELAAAAQQATFADNLLRIERQRTDAGVDSDLESLQTRLKVAEINLQRLHLETRASTLSKQLAVLTGLPLGSITPDHSSIPEIPAITVDEPSVPLAGVEAANAQARSRQFLAKGDELAWRRPLIGFGAIYNYDINELNNYAQFFQPHTFTPNNISFALQITIPLFDFALRAKAKQTAAEALRSTVEAEQAKHQSDVEIATLTGSLRELAAQAEVAGLQQQIADAQLKSVLVQLESGNGGAGPGAPAQLTPKAEQLSRMDERQKYEESLEASLSLAKARLGLLRALGHMQDWLNELHSK